MERTEFGAAYYDGASAARHEVMVRVAAEGLWVAGPDVWWRWDEVRVKEEAVLRVERGAAVVVIGSEASREALAAMRPYARVERVSGHSAAFLASVAVGALLLLWAGYRYVLPWAGERAAAAAPVEWEEKLGESAALQMLQGEAVVRSGRGVEAVDAVSRRLQTALRGSPYRYRVSVVRSDLVNAGALPGGRIFVFTGLLKQCENADEFAAVLAHEMMHVERRHGMKNLGRQAAIGTFLALLGSPDSLGLALGTQAAGLKYQRGDEEEADAEGLRLMAKAGFDAREAARFFGKIAREEGGRRFPEYLSTHPDPAGRARRLEEMARALPAEGEPPMSERAWRAAIAELP